MNRQIRLVGIGMMGLFLILFGALNYLQVVRAPALQSNALNGARVVSAYDKPRGAIITSDGVTLADSVPTPKGSAFKYLRRYPTGSLFGQITGYYSFIYGADGVEKTYNDILTGADQKAGFPTSLTGLRQLLTEPSQAQNVVLTLNDKLQQLARSQLAGRDGSVVALDPATGAILAMYSNPSYNPGPISQLSTVREQRAYKRLLAGAGNPLLPGAYRNRWFPGSTFKVITSSAIYDHRPALATQVLPQLSALHLPQTTGLLHNFAGEVCGGQLPELFTVSCDTGFGKLGLELGANALSEEAKAFGFDASPPLDLPYPAQSFFPKASSFAQNLPTLAFSAIGQEDVQATPLGMAMVAGAIADNGRMMTPHVLQDITNAQDQVVSRYTDKMWKQATSSATAAKVTALMESVVSSPNGTGQIAAIPGVQVAGKTGTAQTGTNHNDDWFVAFAPANHPSIAVAVVLPNQPPGVASQGGTYAAPIAKAIMEQWLAGHHGGVVRPAIPSLSTTTTTAAPPATPSTTAAAPTTTAPRSTTTATPPTTTPAPSTTGPASSTTKPSTTTTAAAPTTTTGKGTG